MTNRWLAAVSVVCAVAVAAPRTVQACGGCFAQSATSVTAHRMALSISQTQTTLWDQFTYAGAPEEFSWILPIRNDPNVRVELADDRFLSALDQLSAPLVTPPPPRPVQYCGSDYGTASPGFSADASAADASGVHVYQQDVVGPYAVVVLGGEDPMAVRNWLTDHGYTIPAAVVPVLDYYTSIHQDFVAVRLRPGQGISRMSPVRVTLPGYQPTLPLRMISAGIGDSVELQLFVIADSRMEASNFPNGQIHDTDLVFDYNVNSWPPNAAGDFRAVYTRQNAASANRLWLTESAQTNTIENFTYQFSYYGPSNRDPYGNPIRCGSADAGTSSDGGPTDVDAGPSDDASASIDASVAPPDASPPGDGGTCTPSTDPVDDARIAVIGLHTPVVTRLYANLRAAGLDRDLALQASTGSDVSRNYNYGTLLNRPSAPPPCPPMTSGSGLPGSSGTSSIRCSAGHSTHGGALALGALGAGLGVVVLRRRRRGARK